MYATGSLKKSQNKTTAQRNIPQREQELRKWIEIILEKSICQDENQNFNLRSSLENGVFLCQIMLRLKEKSIPKIHYNPSSLLLKKQNIVYFLNAMESFGLPRHKQFQITDLYDPEKFYRVIESLETLVFLTQQEQEKDQTNTEPASIDSSKSSLLQEIDVKSLIEGQNERVFSHRCRPLPKPIPVLKVNENVNLVKQDVQANVRKNVKANEKPTLFTYYQTLSPQKKQKITKAIVSLQAHVRRRIAQRLYEKRLTNSEYRKNIAEEILNTEEVYVNHLKILNKHIYLPLKQALDSGKPIIKEKYLKDIFSDSIEQILQCNSILLENLTSRVKNWSSHQCIGDVFLSITENFKIYTKYITDFDKSSLSLKKVQEKTKFIQFLQQLRENPEIGNKSLVQYLILPVQRIPRYNLLLADLIKHTWSDHQDYSNLKNALEKMEEVANFINEKKREAELFQKLVDIEKKLSNKIEGFIDPSRKYIREGIVAVIEEDQEPIDRILYLFSDKLMLAKTTKLVGKAGLKAILFWDLRDINLEASESKVFSTSFVLENTGETLQLFVTTKEEKDLWISEITKYKKILQEKDSKDVILKPRTASLPTKLKSNTDSFDIRVDLLKKATRAEGVKNLLGLKTKEKEPILEISEPSLVNETTSRSNSPSIQRPVSPSPTRPLPILLRPQSPMRNNSRNIPTSSDKKLPQNPSNNSLQLNPIQKINHIPSSTESQGPVSSSPTQVNTTSSPSESRKLPSNSLSSSSPGISNSPISFSPTQSTNLAKKLRTHTFPSSLKLKEKATEETIPQKQDEKILKKGWLQKLGTIGWKNIWCELKESAFYYYKNPAEMNPLGEIILTETSTTIEEDKIAKEKQNVIHIAQGKNHWCFSAPSKNEMLDWISAFHFLIYGVSKCPSCQNEVILSAMKFCSNCGIKIN